MEKMEKNTKTEFYNLIILDRSGSMETIRTEAINGCNETLGTIKSAQRNNAHTQKHFVSLLEFCSCRLNYVFENVPVDDARSIGENDYEPCCCTPLYDAMGNGLNSLFNLVKDKEDVAVSVTIITDGYENASKEYDACAIVALIDRLKAKGWLFAYIGADHDVERVAAGIHIDNTLRFNKTKEGTRTMFLQDRKSRIRWYTKMSDAHDERINMTADEREASDARMARDYFKKDKEEDKGEK